MSSFSNIDDRFHQHFWKKSRYSLEKSLLIFLLIFFTSLLSYFVYSQTLSVAYLAVAYLFRFGVSVFS